MRGEHVVDGLGVAQIDDRGVAAAVGDADLPALHPLAVVQLAQRHRLVDETAQAERERARADRIRIRGETRAQQLLRCAF